MNVKLFGLSANSGRIIVSNSLWPPLPKSPGLSVQISVIVDLVDVSTASSYGPRGALVVT